MTEDEKLLETLRHQGRLRSIDPSIRRELLAEIAQSLDEGRHKFEESDDEQNDIIVDLPIDDWPRSAGGPLRVRMLCHPAARGANLEYKVLRLSPAAQRALLLILTDAVGADVAAGRTPPKPSTLQ